VSLSAGIALLLGVSARAEQTASPVASPSSSVAPAVEGKPAPDFALQTVDKKPLTLSELRGKVVLLNFWATWCPPCRAELPQLVQMQEKYRGQGLVVLGVSFDDTEAKAEKFAKDKQINYPVARITPEFNQSYGAFLGLSDSILVRPDGMINATLPSMIVIDRAGRISFLHIGSIEIPELEKEVQKALARA